MSGATSDEYPFFHVSLLELWKPGRAVPFGGAYRIIDLLMSNMLNSGINKIHILTAFNR